MPGSGTNNYGFIWGVKDRFSIFVEVSFFQLSDVQKSDVQKLFS
jgi:5-keto 4-deoxyuronate isomerase